MRQISLGLMLLISLSANAKDCEKGAESMSAIRACIEDESSEPVDAAYRNLVKALKNDQEAIDAIKKAQDDWRNFRDSTCDYMAKTYKGDGYGADERTNCLTDFNIARVKMLNKYKNRT